MADSELARHQAIWKDFTTFVKVGIGSVVALLVVLWLTLIVK